MARRKDVHERVVYTTEHGRMCPECARPIAACPCSKGVRAPAGDGIVRVRREVRRGRDVTVVVGLQLDVSPLKELAKALKKKCGVGGTVKDFNIEIQGDQREIVVSELTALGYIVKKAGG